MAEQDTYPKSLKIVAVLFLLFGLYNLGVMIYNVLHGVFGIQLFALALFGGIGLLIRTEVWRIITLCIICLFIILISGFAVGAYLTGHGVMFWTLIGIMFAIGVLIWLGWMLTRKEIKQLFSRHQESVPGPGAEV
jgi:hypothetical protein